MIFKQSFLIVLILLLLNGCSSLDPGSPDSFLNRDYISDTEVETSAAEEDKIPANFDPVMESTRLALQSSPSDDMLPEQVNQYLKSNAQVPEVNNVWDRLSGLYQLYDINNKRIDSQQKWYLKHKKYIEIISQRAEPFLYIITEEVDKRNIPGEIALLPAIESAFKTNAYSRQKAAGLWQFIPSTGKHFGLKQTWWYDGRKDINKSTHAALTYLVQLNKYYKGDWLLALAAYNAGAGNVNKAIRKNRKKGKAIDYWSLDLPKETKNYVPKLLALAKTINNAEQFGIKLTPIDNKAQFVLVDTQSQIDLSMAAKMSGITLKEVQTYNPAFKRWATDPDGPHHLLLPINSVEQFENKIALLDDKDRVQWHRHKIRPGESLSVIAHQYNISVRALKKANKLKSNRIRAGKFLMLPVGPSSNKLISSATKATGNTTNSNAQTYTVRKGDSFWKIARRFNMPHRKLASLNGLSSGDTLSIGQVLTIASSKNITKTKTNEIRYKVKQGDSLYVISKRFNVSINQLKSWNGLYNKKYLQPGQELKILVKVAAADKISQTI